MQSAITQSVKTRLVNLIELLPEDKTKEVEKYLKSLVQKNDIQQKTKKQSFEKWLESKPTERLTRDEEKELKETLEEVKRGEVISYEEYKRRREKQRRKPK